MNLPEWTYLVTFTLTGVLFALVTWAIWPNTPWYLAAQILGVLVGARIWLRIRFGEW